MEASKMVRLIPSSVFVKDPVDVWGEEQTIGLAEHSVRTHAPSMMHDRRGDVIAWDNFESPTRKYANTTGTVTRSSDRSKTGDFSIKCVTGGVSGNRSGVLYIQSDFHSDTNMGVQVSFSTAGDVWGMIIGFSYYDMTKIHTWSIRLKSDGTLEYGDLAGTWQTVTGASSIYKQNSYNFATIKVVGDISTDKYVRAVLFDEEYDLSAYTCYSAAVPATMPYLYPLVDIETLEAVAKTAYFDNYILTENEPA